MPATIDTPLRRTAVSARPGDIAARLAKVVEATALRDRRERSGVVPKSFEELLDRVISAGDLVPFFQPQISLVTGRLLGFEALARWRLPTGEVLTPAHFLAPAMRAGQIERIDDAILVGALDALANWRRAGFDVPRVSINASADAVRNGAFLDRLRFHLDMRGLVPGDVAVEIVESTLIDSDEDIAIRNIRAMARAGVAVELDDFGSGHAALSNLIRLDLSAIKLDRAIVRGLGGDGRSEKILRALVMMADELDLVTIAEGAETADDLETLAGLGCGAVQGFAIARPMAETEATVWIERHHATEPSPREDWSGACRLSA